MRNKLRFRYVPLLLACFALNIPAHAQNNWHGHHDVAVSVLNELSFGTLVIGRDVQEAITYSNPAAGCAVISGLQHNETVTLDFYLPQNLTSGNDQLGISFDANSAGWSTNNDAASATSFNPNSRLRLPSSAAACGKVYIWVGATIHVNPQQATGQYQGTIRVQVNVEHDDD